MFISSFCSNPGLRHKLHEAKPVNLFARDEMVDSSMSSPGKDEKRTTALSSATVKYKGGLVPAVQAKPSHVKAADRLHYRSGGEREHPYSTRVSPVIHKTTESAPSGYPGAALNCRHLRLLAAGRCFLVASRLGTPAGPRRFLLCCC